MRNIQSVVVKFAGDSGDGIQLLGTLFTDTSATMGYEIATFPDFPSEIRAPVGTVSGVSGYQIHFGGSGVYGPGDAPDVLVALNPAALRANMHVLAPGCTVIIDSDTFSKRDFERAGFTTNPFEDNTLDDFNVITVPISSLTRTAVADLGLDSKTSARSKNVFALGIVYWLFTEPLDPTIKVFKTRFGKDPAVAEANIRALNAGHTYAMSIEAIPGAYTVLPAQKPSGRYRNITGNQATAWGVMAAAVKAGRNLFLGTYPITPASDILHEITKHKWAGIRIFQAEDEIAGISSAIGASYAGNIAVTTTSGPGMALKTEALGLAIMAELPLVLINVQRGGPSTGLPTKTEQSDLLQAIYGRNGEAPVVVLSANSPGNCFDMAFEAVRIAVEHTTPVVLLTESYLANGSEAWRIKEMKDLPTIHANVVENGATDWKPYGRDAETYARKWVAAGAPGLRHRIGGLEKTDGSGAVSHDPDNHEQMVKSRAEKVRRVANRIPPQKVRGKDADDLLVVGWGGQFGILMAAVDNLRKEGHNVALTNFNYINPLPSNTAEIFARFKRIVVCELNSGQFVSYLRAVLPQFKYGQINAVKGLPFRSSELIVRLKEILNEGVN